MFTRHLHIRVLVLLVLGLLAFALPLLWTTHSLVLHLTDQADSAQLESAARLAGVLVLPFLVDGDHDEIQAALESLGASGSRPIRLTVILPDGVVVADTAELPARMENHAARPEVKAALEGNPQAATRFSQTLRERMTYFAAPVYAGGEAGGELAGVVRAALPAEPPLAPSRLILEQVLPWSIIGLALTALLALFVLRRLTDSFQPLSAGMRRFAGGQFDHKIPALPVEEFDDIGESLNAMAASVDSRLKQALNQRNELQAVLSSMVEGVLVLDANDRLISVNPAARRIFSVPPETPVTGQTLHQVIRNADLQRLLEDHARAAAPLESEITLFDDEQQRILAATCSSVGAEGQAPTATLLVLHDITQLKQLENMRRDFAANVSHELRTPITAIKGYIETLLDGAIAQPGDAQRFLNVINKNCQRLEAIIEDLLALSRIEEAEKESVIALAASPLKPVLEAAIAACEDAARQKQIAIHLECGPETSANINGPLLEQALVNLLQNAVTYSDPGKDVSIRVSVNEKIHIAVQDHGCGIEPRYLPRLFERFYRVDKARSRTHGGTGLGLAIVKHIVRVHGGEVTVQSKPRNGSTFTITLPIPPPSAPQPPS